MIDFYGWTQHETLKKWIEEKVLLCEPDSVHLCTGTKEEFESICQLLVDQGIFVKLNEEKRPGSFWCASSPSDVARVEERTFICCKEKEDAGITNNWKDPEEMKKTLQALFKGCMHGRRMYVIPFSMGPLHSKLSMIGVEITDSAYVAANMYLMTRMGVEALKEIGSNGDFIPCLHSVGHPLKKGERDLPWPCSETKYIVHFPEERSIWSYGSGYGGNALLGKKCLALRIASVAAREEGWFAEHMLILGLTNPEGKKIYVAAAFPSACGKTNLAMITPTIPGWKVECVGDDIAWMRFGKDGRLYAINPENGFFGVAPGTSFSSNPIAMDTIKKNTIFTNVALTPDKDVWWEGMTKTPPENLTSWKREPWHPNMAEPAAHPNARFTVSARQCPIISAKVDDVEGVPLSAIIFGGRRAHLQPLVYEALDWEHGTFLGAALTSEMTAAAKGVVGQLRHDPFAMLPFCGYNMGDYFSHWFEMGEGDHKKLPKIFHVNWFKKDQEGKFLWPGFGDNSYVLRWIFNRCCGSENAKKTALGWMPSEFDVDSLPLSKGMIKDLFVIDKVKWKEEVDEMRQYFAQFGSKLPDEILNQIENLDKRLDEIN